MKMKKLIPIILALGISAATFGGCATKPEEETSGKYDDLNAMLEHNYSQIVLTVTNEFDKDTTLTSEYTMKFADDSMTLTYSIERFSEVSLDSVVPEKIVLVGEVVDWAVTDIQDDEVNLDAITAGTGLNFKEEYFENIDLTGIYLKADVTNPSGFMGSELTCTEMKVNATFLEVFYDIKITYKAQNGNCIEYLYVFSR